MTSTLKGGDFEVKSVKLMYFFKKNSFLLGRKVQTNCVYKSVYSNDDQRGVYQKWFIC